MRCISQREGQVFNAFYELQSSNHPIATDVEGIFRLSGSAKRIKDLQTIFNSPERYGKGLDWTGYTVHDAANILRRYLNQLPEPIVPLDFYDRFRNPLRRAHSSGQTDGEAQPIDLNLEQHRAAVSSYQKLITELPPLNRQLLLYILDLLAVFASKSDLNRMTAGNLAAIFQPGIISHPTHDMSPNEYRLSQDVLIFLIENQDNFLIGMSGTAVDEKTQKDVESGPPSIRSPKTVGRSSSNASAGTDSLRKLGVRRNVSVSSRGSRDRASPGVSSPGTPSGLTTFPDGNNGSKVSRSNTVPSKRSPAVAPSRFQKINDSSNSPSPSASYVAPTTPVANRDTTGARSSRSTSVGPDEVLKPAPVNHVVTEPKQPDYQAPPQPPLDTGDTAVQDATSAPQPSVSTPVVGRERKISNLFPKSPIFGPSDPQRQPKKLQKRQKLPGSVNESAQSSVNSLHAEEQGNFHTPLVSPEINSVSRLDPLAAPSGPAFTNTAPTPVTETPAQKQFSTPPYVGGDGGNNAANLKPPKSPPASTRSRSSFTDHSEIEQLDDTRPQEGKERQRHRWRFSSSAKKGENSPLVPPPSFGQHSGARGSNTSLGSSNRPRKSFTGDSQNTQSAYGDSSNMAQQSSLGQSSNDSTEAQKELNAETEKRGLFGKWKAKMVQTRDERHAEKERAKSPPRTEHGASRSSLNAFAQEQLAPRGGSFDIAREKGPQPFQEGQNEKKSSMDIRRDNRSGQ
jgi:hypothetical protein